MTTTDRRATAERRPRPPDPAPAEQLEVAERDALVDARPRGLDEERAASRAPALRRHADARPRGRGARPPRPARRPGSTIPPHVINATGVILHTNLGRAPWPRAARVAAAAARPLVRLPRAGRGDGPAGTPLPRAEDHLVALTGAEDALVVDNNAAALALAVGLAGRRGARRRLARRARRDRRRRADPGDHPPRRRPPDRGRDDEPDPRRRLRGRRSPTVGARSSCGSIRRTSRSAASPSRPISRRVAALAHEHGAIVIDDLGSRRPARHGGVRAGPRADADASVSPAGADLVTVQRRQARRRAAGRADRRPAPTSSPGSGATRSPAPSGPTRRSSPRSPRRSRLYRAGRAATEIPVWQMIAASRRAAFAPGASRIAGVAPAIAGRDADPGRRARVDGRRRLAAGRGPAVGRRRRPGRPSARPAAGRPPRAGPGRILGADRGRTRSLLDLRTVDPFDDGAIARARSATLRRRRRDDRRHRDRRPHRPRQDDPAPGPDRDRRRPAAGGARAGA